MTPKTMQHKHQGLTNKKGREGVVSAGEIREKESTQQSTPAASRPRRENQTQTKWENWKNLETENWGATQLSTLFYSFSLPLIPSLSLSMSLV